MKLIKFRGKPIEPVGLDDSIWVYGFYYYRDWDNLHLIRVQKDQHFTDRVVDPETVGQLLGYDEDKAEVYDDDIVDVFNVYNFYSPENEETGEELEGEPLWEHLRNDRDAFLCRQIVVDKGGGYWCDVDDGDSCPLLFDREQAVIKVVGNIHDTPELLTKPKE